MAKRVAPPRSPSRNRREIRLTTSSRFGSPAQGDASDALRSVMSSMIVCRMRRPSWSCRTAIRTSARKGVPSSRRASHLGALRIPWAIARATCSRKASRERVPSGWRSADRSMMRDPLSCSMLEARYRRSAAALQSMKAWVSSDRRVTAVAVPSKSERYRRSESTRARAERSLASSRRSRSAMVAFRSSSPTPPAE